MNFAKYQTLARRTESLHDFIDERTELEYRLNHANIGLQTEIGELFENDGDDDLNTKEEIGDTFWYLDLGCSALGVTIDQLPTVRLDTKHDTIIALVIYNARFADLVKRCIYYRSMPEDFKKKCLDVLAQIQGHLMNLADDHTIPVTEILEANIAKLTKRYPDKYSDELAVNRDVEAERAVLEN